MNVRNTIDSLSGALSVERTGGANEASSAVPAHNGKVQSSAFTGEQTRLSTTGTEIAGAASVSDVRLDKVAAIQGALQAGTYSVPASAVAQKLIGSMLGQGN
jgi:flagellar biosynthesis anti-sigma factor FlgM